MPEFSYIAMERTGIRKQGSLTAGSEREAMALLDSRGLFPVNITLSKSASKGSFGWSRKIKSRFMAAKISARSYQGQCPSRSISVEAGGCRRRAAS